MRQTTSQTTSEEFMAWDPPGNYKYSYQCKVEGAINVTFNVECIYYFWIE